MSLIATMPSANPTCASCGVAIRSPMAQMPSSPVRQRSSTSTKPRSLTTTALSDPSRPSDSAYGRRPTDITTRSTSIDSPSPNCTVVPPPFLSGVWPVTFTPVRTSIPRCLNDRSTICVTSLSTPGSTFGSTSRIVTFVPRSLIIDANSQPIAPPPTTTAEPGSLSIDSSSSLVTTSLPSTSKPGIVRGTEPDARITASPVTSTSPLSPPVTFTVLPGCSVPVPRYVVTLRPFSRPCNPFHKPSTIFCLRAIVTDQSSDG